MDSINSLPSLGTYLMKVEMFPVFFYVHFIFSCLIVREDTKDSGAYFRQKHPLTSWLCSLVASFSGAFLAGFLFGDPLVDVLQENTLILFFTLVWYLFNYSPGDVVYKLMSSPYFLVPASIIHEGLRLRFVYLGLFAAAKIYPKSPFIILLGGIIKGNGYGFIKLLERLIRGKWDPRANEFMIISYFTKSAVCACILFLLHHLKTITTPMEILYLIVYVCFIAGRLVFMANGMEDPFVWVEGPICRALFGNWEPASSISGKTKDATKKNGNKKKD